MRLPTNSKALIALIVIMVMTIPQTLIAFDTASYRQQDGKIMRIFYFRNGENARKSLYTNYNSIDVLAPQAYAVNKDGTLESDIDPEIVKFALLHNIKIMPLVTNKGFSQAALKSVLDDATRQDQFVRELVSEAKQKGYYGWQIDFEQMDESYKDRFTSFVSKFGQSMKDAGLVSSVAVIAKISDRPEDYKTGLWHKLIGVYDYSALASATDFISVMSYDDPESKGPIARYSWIIKVIEYAKTKVSPNKISLGIPLYYWKWDDKTKKLVGIGGSEGLEIAKQKYKVSIGYSAIEKAPYMKYTQNKKSYTIWFENAESIKEKLKLIAHYDLLGFSAWALGQEMPIVHNAIKQ